MSAVTGEPGQSENETRKTLCKNPRPHREVIAMSIAVSGVISSLFVIMAVEAWMKGQPPTRIHLGHNRSRHVHNHAPWRSQ